MKASWSIRWTRLTVKLLIERVWVNEGEWALPPIRTTSNCSKKSNIRGRPVVNYFSRKLLKYSSSTLAPSRSVEHEGRARSASVHPKGSDTPQHIRYSSQPRADARVRRSLSYDREPNISSVDFGENERAVLGATSPLHPFPPGTPIVIEYRNGNGQITGGTQRAQNRERSVEKGRRKSVGR